MKIALIADTFPPLRTSGAVQLRDLSREFQKQGHDLTVIVPSKLQGKAFTVEYQGGIRIIRIKNLDSKKTGYFTRTLIELVMPYIMLRRLQKIQIFDEMWDGIVFYSPSIFLAPLVNNLKSNSCCKSYLILRDIFPEWAVDIGLMGRGLPYFFFKAVAHYQYSVANIIGVQTPGNLVYFDHWRQRNGRRLEVLENWLGPPVSIPCSISVDDSNLSGRTIFVYAGNMGAAQGLDIFIELAEIFQYRKDLGFIFVGRGTSLKKLMQRSTERKLTNILFFDEIDPDEIPELYSQCRVGIVALDPHHKTHNIPGKFISYMQSGLPVLANVNSGNDLSELIRKYNVGQVCESNNINDLVNLTNILLSQLKDDANISDRCKKLFQSNYSSEKAVKIITSSLSI